MNKSLDYKIITLGDLNAFFGLMFDNLTVLSFLSGILVFGFNFPAEIVYTKMFPGTALGVLFGDLVYSWMAIRLAKKTGNKGVTAMPLGLDTPSTIGVALVVLGPSFIGLKAEGMDEYNAAMMTWFIGMSTMVSIGIFKLIFSFIGPFIQKTISKAGILGSLSGVGLALIAVLPLVDVFGMPVIGLISLGLIFYSLIAKNMLPKNIPSVFAAIFIGTLIYYIFGSTGWIGDKFTGFPELNFHQGIPLPNLNFLEGFSRSLKYLPVAVPFAILTVAGGINNAESAKEAGDNYNTRNILLTEALSTLIAGLCGGVAQTTPYIGHPAYKRMGAKTGYTIITGIFIGLGGIMGYISFFVELIPRAVLAPILIFVAIDIVVQSFSACPEKHYPAIVFAFLPSIARLLSIKLGNPVIVPAENFQRLLNEHGKSIPELLVTIALGNGFILTGMLWGGFLADLIDKKLKKSAIYLFIMAVFTFFGIIHSASPDGALYFPWLLNEMQQKVPYQFALGYAVFGIMLIIFSYISGEEEKI